MSEPKPQTVDYDALAKQAGGTVVDYDVLAKQAGGAVQQDTPPLAAPHDKGVLRRVWDAVNTPVADFVLPKDIKTADIIKGALFETAGLGAYVPGVNDEHTLAQVRLGDTPTKAAVRTFVSGALGDTGQLAASATTPLAIGTMAAGAAGKVPGAVGTLAKAVTGAAGAGFAASGAKDIADAGTANTPDAWKQRLQGGAAVAGGLAGADESAKGMITDAAPALAEKLQTSARAQYQKALNPTKERTKFLADKRTQEMLDRGITAKSPQELARRAGSEAGKATQELNDIYESMPGDRSSPTKPMVDALEQYKSQFQDRLPLTEDQLRQEITKNNGAVPENIVKKADGSIEKVVNIDEHAVNAANEMQGIIKQYGDTISPRSMRKVRQIFDESVAKGGGYEGRSLPEGSLLDARREAAGAIRTQLAKDNPELVPLNNEVNFWLDVQKIARETAKRRIGQQGGLTVEMARQGGRVAGAGVGYAVGGPMGAAAGGYLGGQVAADLARVTRSTKWRTVSAVEKNSLADKLASGSIRAAGAQVRSIGTKYGISLAAVETSKQTSDEAQQAGPASE